MYALIRKYKRGYFDFTDFLAVWNELPQKQDIKNVISLIDEDLDKLYVGEECQSGVMFYSLITFEEGKYINC